MDLIDLDEVVGGRYQLKDIAPKEGGFAFLYSAWDGQLGRDIALKVLKPQKAQEIWRERFFTEGELLAQLNHPNVVHVYDRGIHKDLYYLVMEWVEGKVLSSWKKDIILPEDSITLLLDIALGIANGIAAVHKKYIVHGDISPNNIIILTQDNKWFPKIVDFGLSWHPETSQPTKAKTLYYAAPEQFIEGHQVSAKSDIYSLGAVLFFLFSGEHYIVNIDKEEDRKKLEELIQAKPARSLQSLLGACNADLDDLLLRMLEKKPSDRPDITQICQDLKAIFDQYSMKNSQIRSPLHSTDDSSEKIGGFTKRLIEMRQSQGLPIDDVVKAYKEKPSHIDVNLFIPVGVAKHIRDTSIGVRLVQLKNLNGDDLLGDDQKLVNLLFDRTKIYDFCLYNLGLNRGEPRIRICLRTDTENPNNLEYVTKLKKTLVIECVYRSQFKNLMLIKVFLGDIDAGRFVKSGVTVSMRFLPTTRNSSIEFPSRLLAEIQQKPEGTHYNTITQEKIIHWTYYLNTWKRLVEEKKYEVRYSRYLFSEEQIPRTLTFWLRTNLEISWEKIRASWGQPLVLKIYPKQNSLRGEVFLDEVAEIIVIGNLEYSNQKDGYIRIQLDLEFLSLGRDDIANTLREDNTYIAFDPSGDSSQIKRQQESLTQLVEGRMANPYLDSFIFDPSQARDPGSVRDWIALRRDKLLIESIADNPSQFEAVENALNASDLYLIQGPPGTGKTTVIAELCYQAVQRGERVLIASQTNLAVDNALNRLGHQPNILALRIGNLERVEPEGIPFTENNVVQTWFDKTADACIKKLEENEEISSFTRVFEDQDFLRAYAILLEDHPQKMEEFSIQQGQLYQYKNEAKRLLEHAEDNFSEMLELEKEFMKVGEHIQQREVAIEPVGKLWLDFTIKTSVYQDYLAQLLSIIEAARIKNKDTIEKIIRTYLNPAERLKLTKIASGELSYALHKITAIFKIAHDLGKILDAPSTEKINPLGIWTHLFESFQDTFEEAKQKLEDLSQNYRNTVDKLDDLEKTRNSYLDREEGEYGIYSSYWEETHNAIPQDLLESLGEVTNIHTPDYIKKIINMAQTDIWNKRYLRQQFLINETSEFAQDWVQRLRSQSQRDVDEMREIYMKMANIIGVTCGQAYKVDQNSSDPRPFDMVIVDEVSKATPPELLMPILRARRIVLVGDHKQLPPMIASETLTEIAENFFMDETELAHLRQSLFKNLFEAASGQIKTMLTKQYRMRQPIMSAINQFYGDELTGGHDRPHGFNLERIDPDDCLVWAATPIDNSEIRLGTSFWNEKEVKVIEKILQDMDTYWQTTGEPPKEIGVITFYGQQSKAFESRFQNRFSSLDLRIGTVDRFQGIERQVVIVSLVRNNNKGLIGFAKEKERINVALSRAQELLIIVGCKDLFTTNATNAEEALGVYSRVAEVVKREGKIIDVSEFGIYR